MLKKQQRLTKKEFDAVFKTGRRYHTPLLQLIYAAGSHFHGAAVVGKKVYKSAVSRNRVRRRLYAILYSLHKAGRLQHGTFLVIAKPPCKGVDYQELSTNLKGLVDQIEKKKPNS